MIGGENLSQNLSCSGEVISTILVSVFYKYTSLLTSEARMILSLVPVLLFSVGLILDFCFHHKLVKEPVTLNPVSLIFKVLKYAAKHKYPVQRSAFTYCENEQPTRLDYGKSKYGGPFTTEQVEDVKTFWRVLLVLLVIFILSIPLTASINLTNSQAPFWNAIEPSSIIMYFVPLYELLIYPCLRNRSPSILKSVGIGAAAVILTSLYGVIAEIMRQVVTHGSIECMLTHTVPNENEIIPINILVGLTYIILFKSTIEFICAQAPYNMNGMLIGMSLTMSFLFSTLGALLRFTWSSKWFDILDTSTCGIWFYLTTLVLAVMSSPLLGLVIQWYKARERDEITPSQHLVEEVYQLTYAEKAPLCLRRSTNETAITPSTFGFCKSTIRATYILIHVSLTCYTIDMHLSGIHLYLRSCDLLHLHSIAEQRSGWEVGLHKVLDDHHPHIRIVELSVFSSETKILRGLY